MGPRKGAFFVGGNMAKKFKTNALRILDNHKIKYEIQEVGYDENVDLIDKIKAKATYPLANHLKTIVCQSEHGYLVACISIDREIDLKALAKVSRNKKVELINLKDLFAITGYLRGGCSPVGLKKPFPVYFDDAVASMETILVSAGKRGYQMAVGKDELVGLLNGTVAKIARD